MEDSIVLFWFRQDLRIADNPGLVEAVKRGAVLPVYVFDEISPGPFKMGSSSRWWLYHSLKKLNEQLDGSLNVYKGVARTIIPTIAERNGVSAVFFNRCYEPWYIKNDALIEKKLKRMSIVSQSFNASLLWEPWEVAKDDGDFYKVYTPYKKECSEVQSPRKPVAAPKKIMVVKDVSNSSTIDSLLLPQKKEQFASIKSYWTVGEQAAKKKCANFVKKSLCGYKKNRDYPALKATSELSPHLHFGEISPHIVWDTVQKSDANAVECIEGKKQFLSELTWREFSYYLLYHFPELPVRNFKDSFDSFGWKHDATHLKAWQEGKTGYPIVDAGMRQLWQTGYMHNRVRMVTASFLIKNLLIHWHHGQEWFWENLVDADLASNSFGWQWVAGSGADAAPYFRIFNPVLQGEKFDSEGIYTRQFVPELASLPNKYLFKPWLAPKKVLDECGIILGKTYPEPIVDLSSSRKMALAAYNRIRGKRKK